MAFLIAAIVMTLSVLEGNFLLQASSNVIFSICGILRGSFAFAELPVYQ